MCIDEEDVLDNCISRIRFLSAFFSQPDPDITLEPGEMHGLYLIICDVIRELESLSDGRCSDVFEIASSCNND